MAVVLGHLEGVTGRPVHHGEVTGVGGDRGWYVAPLPLANCIAAAAAVRGDPRS